MGAPADDFLRLGYAEALRVVEAARAEAAAIRTAAEREADLLRVRAEGDAAACRNEGSLYLEKARIVLEIAQARAELAPRVIDLDQAGGAATIDVAMAVAEQLDVERGVTPQRLPGEMDRLLREAVEIAVRETLRSGQDPVSTG